MNIIFYFISSFLYSIGVRIVQLDIKLSIDSDFCSRSLLLLLLLESFHWSVSDSKSPQVSRILLSILANLNNAVVWMISTRPLISKPSNPFINLLMTLSRTPIRIGIIVTFLLHSFSIPSSRYLFFFSLSFDFTLWSAGTATSSKFSFFCWLL